MSDTNAETKKRCGSVIRFDTDCEVVIDLADYESEVVGFLLENPDVISRALGRTGMMLNVVGAIRKVKQELTPGEWEFEFLPRLREVIDG